MNIVKLCLATLVFLALLATVAVFGLQKEDDIPSKGLTMVEKETLHQEQTLARFEQAVVRGDDIPELFPEKK